MKRIKTILFRGLFFFMALQILNLSIDIDYIAVNIAAQNELGDYDDVDSITEFVLEKVFGDSGYTSEDDDDEGNPQRKGQENQQACPLFAEQSVQNPLMAQAYHTNNWATLIHQANKTSKGHFYIIALPPEV